MMRIRERDAARYIMDSDWLEGEAKVAALDLAREAVQTLGSIASNKAVAGQQPPSVMPLAVAAARLAPAYHSALRLIAALVLTPQQYVAHFISSGQEVDDETMVIKGRVPARG